MPRIKSAVARNASGTYVRYLTPATAMARMFKAPLLLGRFFDAQVCPCANCPPVNRGCDLVACSNTVSLRSLLQKECQWSRLRSGLPHVSFTHGSSTEPCAPASQPCALDLLPPTTLSSTAPLKPPVHSLALTHFALPMCGRASKKVIQSPSVPSALHPAFQGAPVYPPERERILGRHAKVTQRRQAEARRRNGGLQLAYGMSLVAGVLVMLAEAPVLRG